MIKFSECASCAFCDSALLRPSYACMRSAENKTNDDILRVSPLLSRTGPRACLCCVHAMGIDLLTALYPYTRLYGQGLKILYDHEWRRWIRLESKSHKDAFSRRKHSHRVISEFCACRKLICHNRLYDSKSVHSECEKIFKDANIANSDKKHRQAKKLFEETSEFILAETVILRELNERARKLSCAYQK